MINTNQDELESDSQYSINNDDFMLAFATESYFKKKILTDERYVRFVVEFSHYDALTL